MSGIFQKLLELTAVRGLGALAFLEEAFEDLVALAAAVLLAGAELGRQAEILGLFLRADANVNHRADHQRQIRPNRGRGQGVSRRHGDYPGIRRLSTNIWTTICAIVSACRQIIWMS